MPLILRTALLRRLVIILFLALAGPAGAAPERVLAVIYAGGYAPWYASFIETLRLALLEGHPELVLDVETLSKRTDGSTRDGGVPDWLLQKYADRHYDVVVAYSPQLAWSAVALRDRLWPRAAVVTSVRGDAEMQALAEAPRVSGILLEDRVASTVKLIFELLPATEHLAVAVETLDADPWRTSWRRGLAMIDRRARWVDLSGLTVAQLRERVAALPPHTAIYFAAPGVAMNGEVRAGREVVGLVSEVANAPLFVDVWPLVGTGAVGGRLSSPREIATQMASQIERILAGTPPAVVGFEAQWPTKLQFDWRAMQRWHIDEARLPNGSDVMNKPPGLWEAYRTQVLVGVSVMLLQSASIVSLLIERRRRYRAELRAREHLATLARLNRGVALGALSAALAHEINQPLGAILAHAETAELLLAQPHDADAHAALRELLCAIREDDQRAAEVLTRLKAWIANASGVLEPVALNPLIVEVGRMLQTELRLRETELRLSLAASLPLVLADGVQVQQVVLNLVLNALDALRQVPTRRRLIEIGTAQVASGKIEVTVQDSGPGLPIIPPAQLFEPFFTTKPEGLGVGLAISAAIVERHGARLEVDNPDEGGARFRFSLRVHMAM
ncbi:ATP-binding protein [Cupriavidus basilensis]|uniref:histidine kinase n=1 Tax=Cupriavidus basilensis TaxID=68895 RepID=A0ABT6ARR5_9BURK|nr:ATP-binding protein [Cupriavidus basilensis]MDF3835149.1 ATP-binding protein [Cupriavidus basilensis]